MAIDACFAYGSLMCADIMSQVAGRSLDGVVAVLPGHARHPVAGEDYPGLVPDPAGRVEGVLYRGVDAAALARLDAFEGDLYERLAVAVEVPGGGPVTAWCYVFRPACRHLLLPGEWRFEAFLATGKARFQARYLGFAALPPG